MFYSLRSVLLVNDNEVERNQLAGALRKAIDCTVLEADSPAQALEILAEEDVSILLTNLFPPDNAGLQLLQDTAKLNAQVVVMVGVPATDRQMALEVLKCGAFFSLNMPYCQEEVIIAASRALQFHDLMTKGEVRGRKLRKSDGFHGIIGQSTRMRKLFGYIEKLASEGDTSVLILGESGTGKELVARAIHAHGPRSQKNFVPVNCAAIPEDLLESELFGYVKGAFTGANQAKMGRVQYADGGTLFLDEIGDMKPALQAKLLRVLQEKEYEPVGGIKPVPVDVRILAATHRDLEKAVAEGTFREDLYYRLNVIPLRIPPLRERRDDIPLLIERFITIFNRKKKQGFHGFEHNALEALLRYPWPGNVRELENLIQRMAIFFPGQKVALDDLPEKYRPADYQAAPQEEADASGPSLVLDDNGIDFNRVVNHFENQLIQQALDLTAGNKREAARLLNLKRTTLIEKLKRKNLLLTGETDF
jgi:DNA-binding NtrC family response regulator